MSLEELIERYRAGSASVVAALEGVTEDQLDVRPPTGWSARMVVHHLADSEIRSCVRLRQLLTESEPLIQGYDEASYPDLLWYDRPVEASLAAFRAVRVANLELLERLSDADLDRWGTHEESGRYTLRDWLTIYAEHAHEHADQIQRAVAGRD